MKKILLQLFFTWMLPLRFISAQTDIDEFILGQMESKHIPGISACIIKEGKLAWEGNYGLANLELNQPVTGSASFMLASISKTFVCTALMQLYEDGLFGLDDDINLYLPFEIHNPNFIDSVITFRQLLTHTSSMKDNWDILNTMYVAGDSPVSLAGFMENYFSPGGDYYDAENNFYDYAPLTAYNYCNEGIALCGYLVELLSGQPFNEYCNQFIFEPLCMNGTAWFLSELDTSQIAHPYIYSGGEYHDQGLYGYPDYPDGQLRTTSISLAKFLWMNMNGGNFEGQQILDSSTVSLIRTPAVPGIDETQGIIWYSYTDYTGTWWGHSGGDAGVSTEMFFNEATQTGVILLTNSSGYHNPIWYELVDMAASLAIADAPDIDCMIEMPESLSTVVKNEINIYPNPANNYISIRSSNPVQHLVICNSLGEEFLTAEHPGDRIGIDELPAGIYEVKILGNDNRIYTGKFIKAQ